MIAILKPERRGVLVGLLFLGLAVAIAVYRMSIGWSETLNDHHAFRQSQTALSAYWMLKEGVRVGYETPVLGYPWEIPLEFPFYQVAVVWFARTTGLAIVEAGRWVSCGAFFGMVAVLIPLLGAFRLRLETRLMLGGLVLLSPFYSFWSRCVMIESTALCLSMLFLLWGWRYYEGGGRWDLGVGSVLGVMAGLAKQTTFLTPFLCVLGVAVWEGFQEVKKHGMGGARVWFKKGLGWFVFLGIPAVVSLLWIVYTGSLRAKNPLASAMFSLGSQWFWNFGSIAQRLEEQTWSVILQRLAFLFGVPGFVYLFGLVLLGFGVGTRKIQWRVGGLLSLFLLHPLVFSNLHVVHDYYTYENGVFLILGVGLMACERLERLPGHWGSYVLPLAMGWVGAMGYGPFERLIRSSPHAAVRQFGEELRKRTQPEEALIWLGFDWNPTGVFYSERRALMLPAWDRLTPELMEQALRATVDGGVRIGGVVVNARSPEAQGSATSVTEAKVMEQLRRLGVSPPVWRVEGSPLR